VFDIRQHTAFTVIEGVIVGAANQIDAEPLQVLKQIWIGRHEGALRNSGRALVPIVHGTFEIGEGGVGAAQNFAQSQEAWFCERREFTREHGVAGERNGEISRFGLVNHFYLPTS
jgi:hypothetical protein